MPGNRRDERYHYDGFSSPNGTIVPDDVFDVLLPRLTDPELRVLLYIIRRTFGFKKASDDISLKQMVEGIRTRDGTVLDGGTGMSKASVARGLKGLTEKGVIVATHNSSPERGNEPTTYALRFRTEPLSQPATGGLSQSETGGRLRLRQARVSPVDPQQTGRQQTEISLSKIRKADSENDLLAGSEQPVEQPELRGGGTDRDDEAGGSRPPKPPVDSVASVLRHRQRRTTADAYDEDRQVIVDYLVDFAREFQDRAPLKASTTRVYHLYQQAGLERATFIERLYQARAITRERQGAIRGGKFPYFLSVLEDLLGLREAEPGRPAGPGEHGR